ncbi:MAG: hypothetical protein IPJ37_17585 [Bacteroidales bacterium]|nr:hypothetical protein [Bacteroidales bacterium]
MFNLEKLRMVLVNAYENSKYYNNLFSSAEFDPYQFSSTAELLKIPFTDKSILRSNKEQILSRSIPKEKLLYVTTGGTSGIPVEVYYTKGRERTRELVFMTDLWKRAGYKKGDRIARLRGTVVTPKGSNSYFRYEPVKNRLYLSTYDLYEENLPFVL